MRFAIRTPFRLVAVFFGSILLSTVSAQEETKKDRPPGEVDISFANTSTVRMILVTETIDVQTPYGKLTIPVREIKQIEFGVHYAEGLEKQIDDAILKLGSDSFRDREAATAELLKLGAEAYPAVHHAATVLTDLEKSRRAKSILQNLKATLPAKEQRLQHNDQIVLPTFTLAGRIVTPTIRAKADYFGEVSLPLPQLRTLRSTETPAEITVSVDAAKYAAIGGNEWMPTEFQVEGKMKIGVTASGTVDLWPQNNGGGVDYTCGPRGYGQGNIGVPIGPGRMRMTPGALIGKVGETGTPFIIGDNYEGTPNREGKLYLQIGPSPWNNQASGTYQVKISVKP